MSIRTDKELMQEALDIMLAAIKAGDWKVDGACDPDLILYEIQMRLDQPDFSNEFKPDWDVMAVMVEEQQRMAKRIEELEAQLLDVTRSMRVWCGCGDQIMPGDDEARCGTCIAFERAGK